MEFFVFTVHNFILLSEKVLGMQDKYKVYNLCSERLYDASLFEGKVCVSLQ